LVNSGEGAPKKDTKDDIQKQASKKDPDYEEMSMQQSCHIRQNLQAQISSGDIDPKEYANTARVLCRSLNESQRREYNTRLPSLVLFFVQKLDNQDGLDYLKPCVDRATMDAVEKIVVSNESQKNVQSQKEGVRDVAEPKERLRIQAQVDFNQCFLELLENDTEYQHLKKRYDEEKTTDCLDQKKKRMAVLRELASEQHDRHQPKDAQKEPVRDSAEEMNVPDRKTPNKKRDLSLSEDGPSPKKGKY